MADIGRPLEESARFTRGGGPPTPDHDANHASRSSRVEQEQERLIQWAKENGKLSRSSRFPPEFARGGEHRVFFQRKSKRYLKATLPDKQKGYGIALGSITHGATPSEYLDRLDLQNLLFGDDIRLERIMVWEGRPIIVTSQPAIRGVEPEQALLDRIMVSKGYERLAEGAYHDESSGLLIFDLFPRNAVRSRDGVVFPIDPVVQRIAPDFADFLRQNPESINRR